MKVIARANCRWTKERPEVLSILNMHLFSSFCLTPSSVPGTVPLYMGDTAVNVADLEGVMVVSGSTF